MATPPKKATLKAFNTGQNRLRRLEGERRAREENPERKVYKKIDYDDPPASGLSVRVILLHPRNIREAMVHSNWAIETCPYCKGAFAIHKTNSLTRYCGKRCAENMKYRRKSARNAAALRYASPEDVHERLLAASLIEDPKDAIRTPEQNLDPTGEAELRHAKQQNVTALNRTLQLANAAAADQAQLIEMREKMAAELMKMREDHDEALANLRAKQAAIMAKEEMVLAKAKQGQLAQDQYDQITSSIVRTVTENIIRAENALKGQIIWTPQQVSLFKLLLNKVLPDARSATKKDDEFEEESLEKLTKEELEAMIKDASTIVSEQ